MSRRWAAVLAVAGCTAVAIVAAPAAAWASYRATDSASLSITAATLAAPTNVSASAHCGPGPGSGVDVSWTATTSTFATGYTVVLTPPSGSTVSKSVSGRTTTSTTVSVKRSGTTYTVTVVATYQAWTSSAGTAPVPILC